MKRITLILLGIVFVLFWTPLFSFAISNDSLLKKIINSNNIRPLPTKPFEKTKKFLLGQALFFDPILSGNRDISCATCHLLKRGTSDALPLAIGTGGIGLGEGRKLKEGTVKVPRNSLDLWNRDNNSVKSLFWDGRVEVLDPKKRIFRSPLGKLLPDGMENALAVQALFPLVRSYEMLGKYGDRSPVGLPNAHANLPNELSKNVRDLSGPKRIQRVHGLIMDRILGLKSNKLKKWQVKYRQLFQEAYHDKPITEMGIKYLGNAIAHFEEIAFATRSAVWDRYVSGDIKAISEKAKYGAVLFYGKGKCFVCHAGPLFSDFEFYSLAVKQNDSGSNMSGEDLGRYYVTSEMGDKYKFRTPPLRNVTLTAPYFHNGVAKTLREAIEHHLRPLYLADKYDETGAFAMNIDKINSVSYVVEKGIHLSEKEVNFIIEFLKTLEDSQAERIADIIPESVPSGLLITRIQK